MIQRDIRRLKLQTEASEGEEVRIMRRNGEWQVRVRNNQGNNLDEFGNIAQPSQTHGINVTNK